MSGNCGWEEDEGWRPQVAPRGGRLPMALVENWKLPVAPAAVDGIIAHAARRPFRRGIFGEQKEGHGVALLDVPADKRKDIEAAVAATHGARSGGWYPGWGESWWWLGMPIAASIAIILAYRINEKFYRQWILPEGYGVLELAQFILALTGFLIALRLAFKPYVKSWRLLFWACCVFAVACLFIAGEEHSWGQHFFRWSTPDYWAQINRQQETNLHNSFRSLNHLPQFILEIGILIGGLLLPLYQFFAGRFSDPLLRLFVPPAALVPTALCVLFFKAVKRANDDDPSLDIVGRPSEALEVFFYLFIAFYMIVFARRIMLMENSRAART